MHPWPLTFNPLAAFDLFSALHPEVFHFLVTQHMHRPVVAIPYSPDGGGFSCPYYPQPLWFCQTRDVRIVMYSVYLLLMHLLPCSILIMTLWHFCDAFCQLACLFTWNVLVPLALWSSICMMSKPAYRILNPFSVCHMHVHSCGIPNVYWSDSTSEIKKNLVERKMIFIPMEFSGGTLE
jgi:hypothetical protein